MPEPAAPSRIERLVRAFERFNETQAPMFDALDPEIEWHLRADLPDTRTLHGHEDVRRLTADWNEAFEDLRLDLGRITEIAEKAVAEIHFRASIRGTGQSVVMDEAWLISWRGERIIEIREYNTVQEALAAAGPAE